MEKFNHELKAPIANLPALECSAAGVRVLKDNSGLADLACRGWGFNAAMLWGLKLRPLLTLGSRSWTFNFPPRTLQHKQQRLSLTYLKPENL